MAQFLPAHHRTKGFEGVYDNDPDDAGGETVFGIARKKNPNWDGWPIVDALKFPGVTKEALTELIKKNATIINAAAEFFKNQYWDINWLDLIENQQIAEELYDTGVNMGTVTAARFLQKSLNILNRQGKDYPDIVVDGKIGPETIRLLNGHKQPAKVLKVLNLYQGAHYLTITEANPVNEKYLNGWIERT